jgi:hypothetical protein
MAKGAAQDVEMGSREREQALLIFYTPRVIAAMHLLFPMSSIPLSTPTPVDSDPSFAFIIHVLPSCCSSVTHA